MDLDGTDDSDSEEEGEIIEHPATILGKYLFLWRGVYLGKAGYWIWCPIKYEIPILSEILILKQTTDPTWKALCQK